MLHAYVAVRRISVLYKVGRKIDTENGKEI
jgi:hypothetical protein